MIDSENKKIYDELNNNTQLYINALYTWYDYFNNNGISFKGTKKELSGDDKLLLSSFLSLFYSDNDLANILRNHNVDLDKITYFCNSLPPIYNDLSESASFSNINLKTIFDAIKERISYINNIDADEISLSDIDAEYIFDYLFSKYSSNCIKELLEERTSLNTSLLKTKAFAEYQEYMNNRIKYFKEDHSIKSNTKKVTIEEIELIFVNNRVFVHILKGKEKVIPIMDNSNKTITINDGDEITKINNQDITRSLFDSFIEKIPTSPIIGLTIKNSNSSKSFHAYREDIFCDENTKKLFDKTNKQKSKPKELGNDITNQPFIKNPAVGREKELDELETILLYPEKDRSVIITGPAGSGKSSLIKGLCFRIQNGTINSKLKDLRLINVDITDCVANTKYAGTLEEKMKALIESAKDNKNIVFCIEEIHRATGAGKTDGDDNSIAQILKQYLDCGDVRIIGTTTNDEYYTYIEPDTAFKSRFEIVDIKEPNDSVLFDIIYDLISSYNKLDDASSIDMNEDDLCILISLLIEGTSTKNRHYQDKESNPRLLINIIKKAYAYAAFDSSEIVTLDHILKSYESNDRIYESSRKRYSSIIRERIPNKKEKKSNIIKFALEK